MRGPLQLHKEKNLSFFFFFAFTKEQKQTEHLHILQLKAELVWNLLDHHAQAGVTVKL